MTDLLSATVIAPSCMIADAYATACMALTARQACRMIESLPDVEGLLVTADSVITTSGFPEILR
ncbi:FAD:protein FMN transferase [uncultured Duncaniella sp.]|uniref:FAD:protein FMN transferase n=1 Tax=uncultured Duncaniella sp. TaxID=2768039 RepID=UPI00263A939C|nr:FAD:protein FMN transferase [uncultured Duncaniella sp.]